MNAKLMNNFALF